ncbi:MAG: NifU family protein [Actinomycetota bacterium]|nr:NifU family protein [Actinomycetota bacterium]
MSKQHLEEVGERLERLLEELRSLEPTARQRAEEAVRLVTDLYGTGLSNVMEIVVGAGDAALLDKLVSDQLVGNLLVLHGLHPFDLPTRIAMALDKVRPYLGSHGGDVEVLDVDGEIGSITIRLLGSCDGCPSSSVTLKMAVEDAIHDAAPEIAHIIVDGWIEPEAPPPPVVPPTPVQLRTKPVRERQASEPMSTTASR